MSRPKILWHSNAPWATTGYGVQTALFAPRIRDLGYDVAISAFWGLAGARMEWDGMMVLPSDEQWGNRLLAPYAAYHSGGDPSDCLTITLMDVWVLKNYPHLRKLNLACWAPVDHDPAPILTRDFFRNSGARPIAMSRFGRDKLAEAGFDPLYVPHGVDTTAYRPMDDRAGVRAAMQVPTDAFLVGMVAMNKGSSPPRKAFPQALEAFRDLRRDHPDAMLYLHTEKYGVHQGMNLMALMDMLEIPDGAVRWAPQLDMELGIPPEAMAHLYSALDVMMLPSYGEGFGIPIIEAQACGTPVIVGGWSSMPELCGAGWQVEGERWYNATQGGWWHVPHIGSIRDALEMAYRSAGSLRQQAREFALAYDADVVTKEFWVPILEELTQ